MIRTPIALVPYLLALAAVLSGLLWHQGDVIAGIGRTIETGTASVGGPFLLVDQSGKPRSDRDFRGRAMLVYFGYTRCPDVCPTTLAVIADAFDKLGTKKDRIVPIFVTLDPERDSPSVLRTYLRAFGGNFVGLTGSLPAVRKMAGEYRVYFTKHPLPGGGYAVDHTSVLYLMDAEGKFVTYYDDVATGPEALAEDLRRRL
jgi:protein SCO1/2